MSALFFFLSCLLAGALADNSTVKVSVYYESLCPDSIKFFITKLIPTYTQQNHNFYNISPVVEIIPFGKANKIGDNKYECQHGSSECDGNKVHACAMRYITDQKMLLNYIGCLMNATTPVNQTIPYPDTDKVCTSHAGNVTANITNCFKTTEGDALVAEKADATTKFVGNNTLTFSVPFIAFNDQYNLNKSSDARNDFRKTLCSQVGLNNDFCADNPSNGAATLSASFALISAILVSFYVTK